MADLPSFSVLSNPAVWIALTTAKTGCQITEITVWLKTLEVLADPVAFITDNNLEPEIFAKAGVNNTDYFNLIVLQSTLPPQGSFNIYEIRLSHTEA
jgi:hypothetical protein